MSLTNRPASMKRRTIATYVAAMPRRVSAGVMIGPTWMLLSGRTNAAPPDVGVTAVSHGHSPHLGDARRPPVARSDDVAVRAVALPLVLVLAVVGLSTISRGPGVPFVTTVRVRLPACAQQGAEQAVLEVPRPKRRAAIVGLPSPVLRIAHKGEAGRRRVR